MPVFQTGLVSASHDYLSSFRFRSPNTCRRILFVEYLSFLSNNLKRPPYQNALWLDLLFISFLLLIKSGFVICQFTVGSLNPLNSSPYFVPGGILFPYFISFLAFVTLSLSGLFNLPCLHHLFSEWAFCIRATFRFVAPCQ
jgi:hypothetical protein